jgi:hypothetical protein
MVAREGFLAVFSTFRYRSASLRYSSRVIVGNRWNKCTLWHLESLNGLVIVVDHDFKNEVFSSFDPSPVKPCGECGRKPLSVLKMLNPQNGKTVRMFKCQCGEQTWTETKE